MASRLLFRFVSRTLSSVPGSTVTAIRRTRWLNLTTSRKAAIQDGRVGLLLGFSAFSCLGYEAYQQLKSSSVLHAAGNEEVMEQADYLYSCAETQKLYQLLLQHKDSNEAEFLWRLARASRDLSLLPDMDPQQKKKLVFEALEYAKRALERDDKCFAAHKWYAVCLSDVGDYEGTKVKIGNSYIIREHLEKAIELNPKDATSIHILGYWCFSFAALPWYQRKVAAAIFSSPPQSTYKEALDFFLKAEEVDPNFYSKNLLMLGRTYLAMNDKQMAQFWLTKAKDYPAHTLEDKEVHREAVELLKKLG
ncbi:regulator of microtubule dynamics protein 1 [Cynoglossus semilaevis]|uniref:Regulator of microtubule dynamics protein 1 n=1 Tax=Cynoglossus semilaevis TaxID=244447 RepID=A0A3P8VZ19_CYNSE|nr:regulator of microtubule dynamics protein 1 [Cynoglossus semilaevis]